MAGSKQHFIPQALQRGFEASKTGKHSQVWVFRKGQAPYPSSTEGVAAERHFYSKPQPGTVTLDDRITDYETKVLSPAIASLRTANLGAVDPEVAASVVSHLSVRAAFVRGSFSELADRMLTVFLDAFSTQEGTRALMEIDSSAPGSKFAKAIRDELATVLPGVPEEGRAKLARIAQFRIRGHFANDFEGFADQAQAQLASMFEVVPSAIERGHNGVLEKELVPAKRTDTLKSLTWTLVEVPATTHVILPDCLALASTRADFSELLPYTLSGDDTLVGVVMPVSATRVLLGTRQATTLDWDALNRAMASASHEFFISSRRDELAESLATHIGKAVSALSRKFVDDAAFSAPARALSGEEGEQAVDEGLESPDVLFEPTGLRSAAIEEALREQLCRPEFAGCLSRLEAIVVTADVANALARRGSPQNDYGKHQVRFGTCITKLTQEDLTCEVLVPVEVTQLLVDGGPAGERAASALIGHQLGRAAYVHYLGRSISIAELHEPRGLLERMLLGMSQFAAAHYFGARMAAPLKMGTEDWAQADAVFAQALNWSLAGLAQARSSYLAQAGVDWNWQSIVLYVEALLATAAPATVMRTLDPVAWAGTQSAKVLRAADLESWFALLSRDLDAYFAARDSWSGLSQLDLLATHAERLLWTFGFYVSPAGENVNIIVWTDEQLVVMRQLLNGTAFRNIRP